jgi:NAD(P)-dependent dehydrogenase (short-subunit alcohol dehydrogenase family)
MIPLENRAVLVVGASLGIGRETAVGFAREGCRVALTYLRDEDEANEATARCRAAGAADAVALPLDVRGEASIRACVAAVVERFGSIDILVHSAGVVVWRPFVDQTPEEIDEQVAVNLTGVMMLTSVALPHVRDAVIVLGSSTALRDVPTLSVYGAAKWGVRGFVKALARELPDKRAFCVHPAHTATRMNDFVGMPAERVAEVVVRAAKGEIDPGPGAEVDVRDHVEG